MFGPAPILKDQELMDRHWRTLIRVVAIMGFISAVGIITMLVALAPD